MQADSAAAENMSVPWRCTVPTAKEEASAPGLPAVQSSRHVLSLDTTPKRSAGCCEGALHTRRRLSSPQAKDIVRLYGSLQCQSEPPHTPQLSTTRPL